MLNNLVVILQHKMPQHAVTRNTASATSVVYNTFLMHFPVNLVTTII